MRSLLLGDWGWGLVPTQLKTENRYIKRNFARVGCFYYMQLDKHHITFLEFVIMLVGKFLGPLRSDDHHRLSNSL